MLKTKQKIALANLVQVVIMFARRIFNKGPETLVNRNGVKWSLDLREGIDFSIWLLGSFEPETVDCYKKILREGDVVLDIGANIGAHTLFLAEAVGSIGKVYAFEPTYYAFSKLTKNCSINPSLAKRIHCFQFMLVDSDFIGGSTPDLYSSWPLKKDDNLHDLHQGRLMSTSGAESRTLDSVTSELSLDRLDCIKLDIDGFECGMFRGACETLSRWHPIIIMELAPYALKEQGESLNELIMLLGKYGYSLFNLNDGGEELPMSAKALEKMIPIGASLNVIARASMALNK